VDYRPWLKEGCSFSEALARTSGDLAWTFWRERAPRPDYFSDGDPSRIDRFALEARFRENLEGSRLVAYGQAHTNDAAIRLIDRGVFRSCNIDWERSAIFFGSSRDGEYRQVRVLPALLAPCACDFLNGRPLQEAFREFILRDSEVLALSERALRLAPKFEATLRGGRCHGQGIHEWPTAYDRWCMATTIHPDPEKRSVFDRNDPDPIEAVIAIEAFKQRYRSFVSLLRSGELEAYGVSDLPGHPCEIPRAVWSHEEFHIRFETGDIVQDNNQSTGFRDHFIRRWAAVTLRKSVQGTGVFHVNGIERDEPRSVTIPHDKTTGSPPRARPKREAVRAAMIKAGLDPASCRLPPKTVASRIQSYLSDPPTDAMAWQALSKMISRIIRAEAQPEDA